MPFLTEPEPLRGKPIHVLPGIRRIVARNPSLMTYRGTNTYLIDRPDGLTILDPGPPDSTHVKDILDAAGSMPIRRIIATHTHHDHLGAAAELQKATSALVHGYKDSALEGYKFDIGLSDGDTVDGLKAVFTPGHAADHLCFEYHLADNTKILFSGDHVMSWSSSIVSPPGGDMLDYYRSLELLLDRDEVYYAAGHGPLLQNPRALVRELLAHRQHREATILAEIKGKTWVVAALAKKLYAKTDPFLIGAAQRNVLAHLLKLKAEGFAVEKEPATELPPGVEVLGPPPEHLDDVGRRFVATIRVDALRRFAAAEVSLAAV